jgi:hypothetical protein
MNSVDGLVKAARKKCDHPTIARIHADTFKRDHGDLVERYGKEKLDAVPCKQMMDR